MSLNTEIFVDMILVDASDYIGNKPEEFGADNHAIDTMRNNKEFRAHLIREIDDFAEDYAVEVQTQKDAADLIWPMYKKWAYECA